MRKIQWELFSIPIQLLFEFPYQRRYLWVQQLPTCLLSDSQAVIYRLCRIYKILSDACLNHHTKSVNML